MVGGATQLSINIFTAAQENTRLRAGGGARQEGSRDHGLGRAKSGHIAPGRNEESAEGTRPGLGPVDGPRERGGLGLPYRGNGGEGKKEVEG